MTRAIATREVPCRLSDCEIPDGNWQRSRVAALYRPICTACTAKPGVYFDGETWRMKPHEVPR